MEWTEPPEQLCTACEKPCGQLLRMCMQDPNCTEDHGHAHGHGHGHHGHGHEHGHSSSKHDSKAPISDWQLKAKHDLSGVSSVGLTVTGNVNEDKFKQFMSMFGSNCMHLI